ncbi:MAG: hypothetical protein ACK5Z5_06340 [Neisseriaceae bacterium]
MKYTIMGFNQAELLRHKLTTDHAIILRWFIDFRGTSKMSSINIDNQNYYWVKYDSLVESLPILRLKKDSIYRKFKDLVECRILKHYTLKVGGTFSYYEVDDNYLNLISDGVQKYGKVSKYSEEILEGSDEDPYSMGQPSIDDSGKNPEQIDSSIRRYSIRDINNTDNKNKKSKVQNRQHDALDANASSVGVNISVSKQQEISQVINYWETKTNKKMSSNTGLYKDISKDIAKVLKSYSFDECKQVIDYIIRSSWHIQNGFTDLKSIFRPSKFAEKLAKVPKIYADNNPDLYSYAGELLTREQMMRKLSDDVQAGRL